jgi:AcrR family transcriptional regulator
MDNLNEPVAASPSGHNGESFPSVDTRRPTSRRRNARTSRQEQILDELERVVLAEGFRHLTLQGLTIELRCSRTILYALAPTKEELVLVVIDRYLRKVGAALVQATNRASSAADRFAAVFDAIAGIAEDASNQFLSDVDEYAPARELHFRHSSMAVAHLRELIGAGIEDGSFQPVHAAFAAEVVRVVMTRISDGSLPANAGMTASDALSELKELLFRGLMSDGARNRMSAAAC